MRASVMLSHVQPSFIFSDTLSAMEKTPSRINVLINAYAVSPNWGSEQGVGWNWVINLARHCNVFVITEGQWRSEIEEALLSLPQRDNIHFYYNPVSERVRKMCWNQGDWRFYIHYRQWQRQVCHIAREICRKEDIKITHQLNMTGFREPGLLWKIDGAKHIWGPIGSMASIPDAILAELPLGLRIKQTVKKIITSYQVNHGAVKRAIMHCDSLVAASYETKRIILEKYDRTATVIGETGLIQNSGHHHEECTDRPIELLWVGRFIPTKKLSIALESLAAVDNTHNFRLHIIGEGTPKENLQYRELAKNLGIADICTFYGRQPNDFVQKMMREKDLFIFTSIHEGNPHVILESIANNLPIICFDICGQGSTVDSSIGIKVPIPTLDEGVKGFVEKLNHIDRNRHLLQQFSANCTQKQQELSWDRKAEQMYEIYGNLLQY